MSVVECSNLTKSFGKTRALEDLSFALSPGKITGLIGRNGAGKTTLLKMIAGHLLPDQGSIKVFGKNPFNNLIVAANLIFIDDRLNLPSSMELADILETAAGFYPNWDQRLAAGLFAYFNLPPRQSYTNLSKGMKSTFNIILGIAARCSLTIFDEPTLGMDAAVRKDFYRVLLKEFMEHHRTIILSSHHLNEVEHLLDEVMLIDEGKKFLHLPVHELKEYAIGLQGGEKEISALTGDGEILYCKELGKDGIYVVARHRFSAEKLQAARLDGVEISIVSPDEIFVYLTAKNEGGIDRVYDRN